MEKETSRSIRLGAFVITGVVLLIVALYFIGNNKNLFGRTFTLYTTFQNISGLQTGNNVRFSGIDVGTIESIEIKSDTIIRIAMIIDNDMRRFIRKNSIASIGTDGLMGNRLINIEPSSLPSQLVEPGDEIVSLKGVNTESMLRTLQLTNDNVAFVSDNLKSITNNIRNSEGSVYSILVDTTLAQTINRILGNIESVSEDLTTASDRASGIIGDVKNGNGLANALIYDTVMTRELQSAMRDIKQTSEKLSTSSKELNEVITKINSGQGSAAVLLNDSIAAKDLQETLHNLKTSSAKLDEDLEGLKHSFLLKKYFRKQEKEKVKNNK